jgi:AcrR family transcriptional regulator
MSDDDFVTAPKGRRYQPAETKQRIIAAARTLFMEKGYANTSTADLAVAADVAEGSIFYHFGSKRALLVALGKIYAEAMVKAMQGDCEKLEDLDPGDMVARCFDFCAVSGTPHDMIDDHAHSGDESLIEDASRDTVLDFVEKVMAASFTKHGICTSNIRLKAAMSYSAVHDALERASRDGVTQEERDLIKAVAMEYIRAVSGVPTINQPR